MVVGGERRELQTGGMVLMLAFTSSLCERFKDRSRGQAIYVGVPIQLLLSNIRRFTQSSNVTSVSVTIQSQAKVPYGHGTLVVVVRDDLGPSRSVRPTGHLVLANYVLQP